MTTSTTAYAVPFEIDRRKAPRLYRLVNTGHEPVLSIRVTLLGSGLLVPVATSRLAPGEAVTLSVVGVELSRSGLAVVRWFRPSREEYLWRFSF